MKNSDRKQREGRRIKELTRWTSIQVIGVPENKNRENERKEIISEHMQIK